MATSKTEICNIALSLFGAKRITSLQDDTAEGRLCNAMYDPARKGLLGMHPWNCAIAITELPQLSSTPDGFFSYQYELPSDCIRVITIENIEDNEYEIMGTKLLTDLDSVVIKYIKNLEDVSKFSSHFSITLSYYLASLIVYNLTNSVSEQQTMIKAFQQQFNFAKMIDGQEGKLNPRIVSNWITDRDKSL